MTHFRLHQDKIQRSGIRKESYQFLICAKSLLRFDQDVDNINFYFEPENCTLLLTTIKTAPDLAYRQSCYILLPIKVVDWFQGLYGMGQPAPVS
jgi:hypothetical protein